MQTLTEIINAKGVRPNVIKDCVIVLNEEVNKKKGPVGFAIRKGFQVVYKLEEGRMIENAIDKLLDGFVNSLEPYYQAFLQEDKSSRPTFQNYLTQREEAVAESLLSVTDRYRERASNKLLIRTYDSLRSMALRQVKSSVPAVGGLIQKYAFATTYAK